MDIRRSFSLRGWSVTGTGFPGKRSAPNLSELKEHLDDALKSYGLVLGGPERRKELDSMILDPYTKHFENGMVQAHLKIFSKHYTENTF